MIQARRSIDFPSNMKTNSSENQPSGMLPGLPTRQFKRGFRQVLIITLLGGAFAWAADPLATGNVLTAMAPKTAQSHMDTLTNSLGQFLHWQMMLRILMGFALAVGCGWFIAWHPRRSTRGDATADLEETKTLILLGMVGAAVAEISKLDDHMAFVIFGIGSLVRFRTVMDNPKVTGKAIMVVVIGLACGMNEWAMAAFVTALTWVLIYWLDSHISARFKLRVTGKQEIRTVFAEAQDFLKKSRCRVKAASLNEAKRSMVIVAHVPAEMDPVELEMNLSARIGEGCDIEVRLY